MTRDAGVGEVHRRYSFHKLHNTCSARDQRIIRYIGLALFAIVSVKVFFVDLRNLDPIYRIIAFVILGLMLLAGSFLYLKHRERFATQHDSDEAK